MPGGTFPYPWPGSFPVNPMTSVPLFAIIGGTGLSRLEGLGTTQTQSVETPFQAAAVTLTSISNEFGNFLFLPRHGEQHRLAPHQINYRANVWALHSAGVKEIIAVNAVGGIHGRLGPGSIAIPEQLIDYSFGREATFYTQDPARQMHVDFTQPYSHQTRQMLLHAVAAVNEAAEEPRSILNHGVYACTQGPRLETAAEVHRLKNAGCDMVGMTGMPEAVLARELDIHYACLALSVNWAAGLGVDPLTMEFMESVTHEGMAFIQQVLWHCMQARAQNS